MPNWGRQKAYEPIGPSHDPQSLYRQMEAFLAWCEERNASAHTLRNWTLYLRYFVSWCDERGLGYPQEVTRPVLERYQRYLFLLRKANGQPLSIASQLGRMHAVQAWFRWLVRSHRLLYNPASDLELPRKETRLPRHVLSAAEVEQVLNVPDVGTAIGVRDRAMLETFYSTGMRRMELIHLHVHDVDYERGTVMIRQGKGRKDRMVPIGERALAWIAKYRDEVRPELALASDDGTLFLTVEGLAFSDNRLSTVASKAVVAAGLGKIGSCHLFRHAMATQMLENGADIRYVQAMLGHADLKTTEIYTQVSIRALKDIHTATHPARLARTVTAGDLLAVLDAEAAEDPTS